MPTRIDPEAERNYDAPGNADSSPLSDPLEDLYNAPAYGEHDDLGLGPSTRQAQIDALNRQFDAPSASEKDRRGALSAEELAEKEASPGKKEDFTYSGKGSNNDAERTKLDKEEDRSKKRKAWFTKRKKVLLVGGMGSAVGGISFFALTMLLPLRFIHIPTTVQDAYNQAANRAMEKMGDNMFHYYVVKYLVPGMVKNGCTSTRRTKSCADVSGKTNIVTANFRAWRDANVEGKLAEKWGLEFRLERTNSGTNKVFVTSPNIAERIELGTYTGNARDFDGKAFAQLRNKTELKREVRTAMRGATLRDKMYVKFIALPRIARKYGIRYCVVACETKKVIKATKAQLLTIARGRFIERVITPLNTSVGTSLECAFSSFDCMELASSDETGERLTKYQEDLRTRLIELQNKHGKLSVEELQKQADEIKSKGAIEYLIKQLAGETTAKIAVKVIPVVGWIDLGAQILSGAQNVGPALKHMNYVMNETAMVGTATMMLTYASELKSGSADPATLNSFAAMLNADPTRDQGGGAAEASPLYRAVVEGGKSPTAGLFSQKAYAETTTAKAMCDNNEGYPSGASICPAVAIGSTSGPATKIADGTSDFARNPALALPGFAAQIWTKLSNTITGAILGPFTDKISELGSALAPEQLKEAMKWLKDEVFAKILVLAPTPNQSGARTFEMMAGGMNVMANYVAHFGLGGKALSAAQTAELRDAAERERREEYVRQPFLARLFNTQDSQSLVSRVAVGMPSNTASLSDSFVSGGSSPFVALGNGLSALASRNAQAAASLPSVDPFGITQYGYPENDEVFTNDPEAYWESAKCDDPTNRVTWGNSATRINEVSQVPEHDQTNPCLLIRAAVGANSGLYNKDNIENLPATNTAVTLTGELGTVGNFTFPLKTTQTRIKSAQYQDASYKLTKWVWCYESQTNCHHDYPAADIFDTPGTEIVAAVSGSVVSYKPKPACSPELGGYPSIQIRGDDGNYYYYAHFRGGSLLQTQVGARIEQGQTLGVIGEPPCAQGTQPHLHFQAYSSVIRGQATATNVQPILIKAFGALPQ